MSAKVENQNETDQQPQIEKPERSIRGLRWVLVCLAVYSSNFLYGLDNTIVADIQAPIVGTFGNVDKLGWLGIGFPLGSIGVILAVGKGYAIFDVKWLYIGSLTMFAAGSALCGAAPNMDALIVGRVWAGAGGAGMYLGNLNMIQLMTIPHERSIYMSGIVLVYGTGAILGPVLGGSLADTSSDGWRWAFYLNLFIFAIMAPIYIFLLPSIPQRPDIHFVTKLRSFDWLGIVLSWGMYTSFAMIFTFGGTIWPWNDGRVIALYVVCGTTFIAFAVQQTFALFTTKENRLFPIEFLSNRTLVLMFISTCCLSGALYITVYYLPLFFQFVGGDNGVEAAVRLLPFVCFYIFGVVLNGFLMIRWGYYMPWFLASGIFSTIGGALLYTSSTGMPYANIYGYSILCGIGLTAFQAAYSIVPTKVGDNQIAEAMQFVNAGQQGSNLIALAMSNTIFQNVALTKLRPILLPAGFSEEDITAAMAGAKSTVLQSASEDVRAATLEVLVEAINDTYILIIVAGGLVLICSLFMKREKITMQMVAGG